MYTKAHKYILRQNPKAALIFLSHKDMQCIFWTLYLLLRKKKLHLLSWHILNSLYGNFNMFIKIFYKYWVFSIDMSFTIRKQTLMINENKNIMSYFCFSFTVPLMNTLISTKQICDSVKLGHFLNWVSVDPY